MTIAAIVFAILVIFIVALAVPVNADIKVTIQGQTASKLRVFYFSPRLAWELGNFHKRKRENGKGKSAGGGRPRRILDVVRVDGLWNKTWVLARRLVSGITVRNLETDLEVSLGDDYYTGMLAGLILPAALFLNERFPCALKIYPAFEEDLRCRGSMDAWIQARPILILGAVAAFMFSRPALQAAWILSRGR